MNERPKLNEQNMYSFQYCAQDIIYSGVYTPTRCDDAAVLCFTMYTQGTPCNIASHLMVWPPLSSSIKSPCYVARLLLVYMFSTTIHPNHIQDSHNENLFYSSGNTQCCCNSDRWYVFSFIYRTWKR